VKIIAGLGNPGPRYSRTRHNVGWLTLDRLAGLCGAEREQDRAGGVLAACQRLRLFKPLSYMNLSGAPVARLMRELEAGPADLLVVLDDMDLGLGRVRLRRRGSSGGHKGLLSVSEALGTEEFCRLRLGIGPRPAGVDGREFVLSPFAPEESDAVESMTERAARAALCWADEGAEAAMNRFNAPEPEGEQ
jgi:PTH1 family peptidyl-tRNA hydrolase